MRWSELDLDAGLWKLPAVRVKNGREHFVALPDFALQIIAAVPKRDGSDQLFGLHAIGYQNWGKGKAMRSTRALTRRSMLGACMIYAERALPAWLISVCSRTSLRQRSIISAVPRPGLPASIIRILYLRETRAALALWADHVRTLVEGGERKVVPLHSAG